MCGIAGKRLQRSTYKILFTGTKSGCRSNGTDHVPILNHRRDILEWVSILLHAERCRMSGWRRPCRGVFFPIPNGPYRMTPFDAYLLVVLRLREWQFDQLLNLLNLRVGTTNVDMPSTVLLGWCRPIILLLRREICGWATPSTQAPTDCCRRMITDIVLAADTSRDNGMVAVDKLIHLWRVSFFRSPPTVDWAVSDCG